MGLPKLAEIDLLITSARSTLNDFAEDSLWAGDLKKTHEELEEAIALLTEAIVLLDKVED